jgi:hypothetical protein
VVEQETLNLLVVGSTPTEPTIHDKRLRDMVDHFVTLDLPRKASLSEEVLQQAYARVCRAAHPDHGGTEKEASEVNEAYQTLRSPEKRLKHLLELAAPPEAKAWRAVPLDDEMMRVFSTLGAALEASTKFLDKKANATSALAKALLANEEMQHRETLEAIGVEIAGLIETMELRLPALDEALMNAGEVVWKEVAALQARFAYVSKWQTQVRERLLLLM